MPWDHTSRRRSQLPANWPAIRRAVLTRDDHTCQIRGPRCAHTATEVDHIGDNLNHDPANLRAACQPCHARRTATQGHDAMRARRATARHPRPRRHPGLT